MSWYPGLHVHYLSVVYFFDPIVFNDNLWLLYIEYDLIFLLSDIGQSVEGVEIEGVIPSDSKYFYIN